MKKTYEPPTVQMMAFRYRDQVVAASGIAPQDLDDGTGNGYTSQDYQEFVEKIWAYIDGFWHWIFG